MSRNLAAFVVIFACVVSLQYLAGAYSADFGGDADEPAHLVSGLMVREYLLSLGATSPMEFAQNYYLHYPKVGVGNWPPLFYLVEAVWTLVTPLSRFSVLLLTGLITALFAFTVVLVARREFGWPAGVGLGLLLLLFPAVQYQSSHVMIDSACALLALWAALLFGRYLAAPTVANGLLWGAAACLAIMTKGNGLALAYLPPLAILFHRRLDLLRRWSLWLPALLVAAVCGPWYWWSFSISHTAWQDDWGLTSPTMLVLIKMLGLGLVPFAFIGLKDRLIGPLRRSGATRQWAVMAALLVAWVLFHSFFVPGGGARKSIGALAPSLLFAAAGIEVVGRAVRLRWLSLAGRTGLVAVLAVSVFVVANFRIPQKHGRAYAEVANWLLSDPTLDQTAILVSADAKGEGALVAETALLQPRPHLFVLRASKLLADSDWYDSDYRLRYQSLESLRAALEAIPVSHLVLAADGTPANQQHHQQLMDLVAAHPSEWELPEDLPVAEGIVVYRNSAGVRKVTGDIHVDLTRTLGREIEP